MKFRALVFAITAGCAISPASAQEQQGARCKWFHNAGLPLLAMFRHWKEPAKPEHIAGPIYFVGTKGLSSWLIKASEDEYILLNTGMPGSGAMIIKSITDLKLDPKKIKLLLAGHAHVDHVGGHAEIQQMSGAKVKVLDAEKTLLEKGVSNDFFYAECRRFKFTPVKISLPTLKDGDTIKHGNISLEVVHTPGHTKGAAIYKMNFDEGGKTYKVVFADGTNVNPGYKVKGPNKTYDEIAADFKKTFQILDALAPDIWLTPHTEEFDLWNKLKSAQTAKPRAEAFRDCKGYKAFIEKKRRAYEEKAGVTNSDHKTTPCP